MCVMEDWSKERGEWSYLYFFDIEKEPSSPAIVLVIVGVWIRRGMEWE